MNFINNIKGLKKTNDDLVNEEIRFSEVLVIDQEGVQLGVMSSRTALEIAIEKKLDLLCVAPSAKPPVCKLVNYGKYRFEQQKKTKEIKKNQKIIDVKEIRLSPVIDVHDIETKVRNTLKWLAKGDKVKVVLRFRGRQLAHLEVGEEVMNRFITKVEGAATVEKQPVLDGKMLIATLNPKK